MNVELSNSKVIKSWKTLSNEKTFTNMKIITVKCKIDEDNNNIKVKSNNVITDGIITLRTSNQVLCNVQTIEIIVLLGH